jgi:HSP20 family protein
MAIFRETGLVSRPPRDVSSLLRQMRSELDDVFEQPFWGTSRWPQFFKAAPETPAWSPRIEVFEKDHSLVTRAELPGLKKEDVRVEIADGQLVISGERKREFEEKKDQMFRSEREYGSFYRSVPLPEGVKPEDVKATFADGVLEITMPLVEVKTEPVHTVEIKDASKATRLVAEAQGKPS